MGGGEIEPKHIFDTLCVLNDAELNATYVKEEITDEWVLNDDDEPEQKIIGEHIKTQANGDHLWIGDYVVKRDGAVYVMAGELFEAIWSLAVTEDVNEWQWILDKKLPYQKRMGYWQNRYNEDIVSLDGGISYFHLSERPLYAPYGPLYKSAPKIGV
jgi:hypothetical protein